MKHLSRRDFLKTCWLVASGAVLSRCQQDGLQTQESPPLTPHPRATPTALPVPTQTTVPNIQRQAFSLPEAEIFYLGYATEENLPFIDSFDVDVLSRAFLLFLNANDTWIQEYGPRFEQLQMENRVVLVALQAAVLVEDIKQIPELSLDDPALAFPQDLITEWDSYACRLPNGDPIKKNFAHACINNPEFQNFFKGKLSLIMDSGADGVHIDELQTRYFTSQEGYCDSCMVGFNNFLDQKFGPTALNSRYGISSLENFDFRDHLTREGYLDKPPQSPLHKEWWLFQLSNLKRIEGEIREFCKSNAGSGDGEFLFNTNAYEPEFNPDRAIEMTLTDYAAIGTGLTINLRKNGTLVPTPRLPPDFSYLPLYAMAKGAAPNKPISLFIDGPGGTELIKAYPESQQDAIVRWMFAEATAAGAHFHVPYPSLDYHAPLEACQDFTRYLRSNQDIFRDASSMPDVGVVFSFASEIWDYWVNPSSMGTNHVLQYYGLTQALTNLSIQFEVIFTPDGTVLPDPLRVEDLLQYNLIILPWVYAINENQLNLFQEFALSGRKLIILGTFASLDEEKSQRETDPVADLINAGATAVPDLDMETYLNDPRGNNAPKTLEHIASLVPNRLTAVSNTSVTAHLQIKPGRLLCHLINRDLRESGFTKQQGVQVQFNLPPNIKVTESSLAFHPQDGSSDEVTHLQLVRNGDTLEVTVPELKVYGFLDLPVSF